MSSKHRSLTVIAMRASNRRSNLKFREIASAQAPRNDINTTSAIALVLAFLLTIYSTAWAQSKPGFPEYQVKAEMLFRFAEFITWPEETFADPDKPFVIAIAGHDPFNSYLTTRANAKKIHDRKVAIVSYEKQKHDEYHVIFIEKSEGKDLKELLTEVNGQPVLTVGDSDEFVKNGAHIGFHVIGGRMRFEINLGSAEKSRLQIPSTLLRLASRVYGEQNK